MSRLPAVLLVALLVAAVASNAVAEPQPASAKRCFKKKHGKRVRVKCKKKRTTPTAPPPTPAPPSMTDPAAINGLASLVAGQMLHRFSTSSSHSDEKLYLCSDATYTYVSALDPADAGLTQAGKPLERGSWRITGAAPEADGYRGGLLMLPSDGTSPHLATLTASRGFSGVTATVNGTQWFASDTACPG